MLHVDSRVVSDTIYFNCNIIWEIISDGRRFDSEYFQETEESNNFRQEYEMRKMRQAGVFTFYLRLELCCCFLSLLAFYYFASVYISIKRLNDVICLHIYFMTPNNLFANQIVECVLARSQMLLPHTFKSASVRFV